VKKPISRPAAKLFLALSLSVSALLVQELAVAYPGPQSSPTPAKTPIQCVFQGIINVVDVANKKALDSLSIGDTVTLGGKTYKVTSASVYVGDQTQSITGKLTYGLTLPVGTYPAGALVFLDATDGSGTVMLKSDPAQDQLTCEEGPTSDHIFNVPFSLSPSSPMPGGTPKP